MVETDWHKQMNRFFGDYESPERESEWQAVVESVHVGQSVTGVVVIRGHYGVYVDIGVGFPALLQTVMMRDLNHETYIADEWYPVGSQVGAQVRILNGRQIGLEQFPFDEYIRAKRAKRAPIKPDSYWWQFWKK